MVYFVTHILPQLQIKNALRKEKKDTKLASPCDKWYSHSQYSSLPTGVLHFAWIGFHQSARTDLFCVRRIIMDCFYVFKGTIAPVVHVEKNTT